MLVLLAACAGAAGVAISPVDCIPDDPYDFNKGSFTIGEYFRDHSPNFKEDYCFETEDFWQLPDLLGMPVTATLDNRVTVQIHTALTVTLARLLTGAKQETVARILGVTCP